MVQQTFSMPLFLLKVREGQHLEKAEIQSFIKNMKTIPDSQLGAFLAHAYHKPLREDNMVDLTLAMRDSGECLQWEGFDKPVVDKHSTGGVGDKVTICLAPLVAALDLAIPTVAGRGLGHTGGTVDKFESIPGFSCDLSSQQLQNQVREIGVAIGKQSDSVAPADRKFYALRDITATVPSIPLITASILSKKLAERLNHLVIDLKWGTGAFMQTLDDARALAKSLINTANGAGTKTTALITNMNQPLGEVSGNFSEVVEAVSVLKNEIFEPGFKETRDLTIRLAAQLYQSVHPNFSADEVLQKCNTALASGKAYEIFCKLLQQQGAKGDYFENDHNLIQECSLVLEITAPRDGVIQSIKTKSLGQALVLAKAGRQTETDIIDTKVALHHPKKVGTRVRAGDVLCRLHFNCQKHEGQIQKILTEAYELTEDSVSPQALIEEVVS